MHCLPDIFLLKWFFWFPVLSLWSNSGGNSSNPTTTTETSTTSGASSPSATGGSQAIGPGSIGVAGSGAKYLESGATDQAGANVGGVQGSDLSASGGATITIGDPNAGNALAQIAEQLASNAGGGGSGSGGGGSVIVPGGGGTSILPALTQNINWSLIAIVAAAVLGLWIFFGRKKK